MNENEKIYYVVAPGTNTPTGPLSMVDLRAHLANGQISEHWLYVVEGMSEWRPLSSLQGLIVPPAPLVPMPPVPMPPAEVQPMPPVPVVVPACAMYYLSPPGSNRIKGPYTLERIALMLNRRKISLQWRYSEPGSLQWRPLSDMPALSAQLLPSVQNAVAPIVQEYTTPASHGLVWSIIFLLLGVWPGLNIICIPAGTVAVVMSILTMVHNSRGNYTLAHNFAGHSRAWRLVALIPECIFYTVLVIIAIAANS